MHVLYLLGTPCQILAETNVDLVPKVIMCADGGVKCQDIDCRYHNQVRK